MIKKLIKNFSIITAPIFILVLIGVYNNNSKDDKLYTQNQMQDTTSYVMNDLQNTDSIDCYTSLINSKALTTLHKEKRKDANDQLVSRKGLIGKAVGFSPMICLFVGYLIIPLVLIGLSTMTSTFNQLAS